MSSVIRAKVHIRPKYAAMETGVSKHDGNAVSQNGKAKSPLSKNKRTAFVRKPTGIASVQVTHELAMFHSESVFSISLIALKSCSVTASTFLG